MADEQAALLAQIAALSGAINSHKSSNAAPPPAHQAAQPYWASSSRGRGRGRGGASSRGAARGGAAAASSSSSSSRNRSLVISQQPNSAQASSSASSATAASAAAPEGWVKKKSTHNMSLVSASTFEKTEPARLAALAASQKPASSAKSAQALSSSSSIGKRKATTGVRRGDNMGEVIIDGVTFVFDATGTKLVKAASQPAASSSSSSTAEQASSSALPTNTAGAAAAADATPLRTSVNGQRFVRTKRGNLISAELLQKRKEDKLQRAKAAKLERLSKDVAQRERLRGASKARNKTLRDSKPKGLCSFFNLTGRCQRGLSCPFTHDITRLAICRGALRPSGCTLAPGTCLLSHKPTPHRAPHCMHYLNAHACRNGDVCLYTHPDAQAGVKPTTAPCAEFQRVGWCAAGKACTARHTWECPEFAREGKCERKGCRLQHVIRAGAAAGASKEVEEVDYLYVPPTGELDDEALFVRDDAAAGTSFEDEEAAGGKRKRPDELEHDEQEEEESGPTFKPRRKKAKEFTAQQDYIGFGDAEEDESDEESNEEEEGEGDEESVHSDEDMDVSEGDSDDMQVSEGQDPSDHSEGE